METVQILYIFLFFIYFFYNFPLGEVKRAFFLLSNAGLDKFHEACKEKKGERQSKV